MMPGGRRLRAALLYTHSMGGILLRYYLGQMERPARLGRVVMLAPPNQGSEWTDLLRGMPVYRKIFGPAGQELGTGPDAIAARLGPADFELGVITGDVSLNPVSRFLFGAPNDGTVSVERSKLAGMKAHCVIRAAHSFIPYNKEAIAQTLQFLEEGKFGGSL